MLLAGLGLLRLKVKGRSGCKVESAAAKFPCISVIFVVPFWGLGVCGFKRALNKRA